MSMSVPYFQAELAKKLLKQLKALNRDASIVYFPKEEKHSIWLDLKQISNDHESAVNALNEGIAKLQKDVSK